MTAASAPAFGFSDEQDAFRTMLRRYFGQACPAGRPFRDMPRNVVR